MLNSLTCGLQRVLLLGAHADDIEIGCGGTIRRILAENPGVEVSWVVFSGNAERQREARASARDFLEGAARAQVRCQGFKESHFPDQWASIKAAFEKVHRQFEPDIIFTHCAQDRHQDHRVLSELTWNTFRNHLILEYEIPKYEGDLGHPNFYVTLTEDVCQRKVSALLRHFQTQSAKHWFTEDTFLALLRLRGIECGPKTHYAEAFHARKLVC